MEAAFFDLDKTVIAKASMMAFGRDFYREGLIGRRSLLKGMWTQLLYVRRGASAEQLARIRRSALALTAGWEQDHVRRVVTGALRAVVDPITYAEALEAISEHRAAGRLVVIVSAAPEEIVSPLAAYLGVDEAIASRAEVGPDGRYTGRMASYAYGAAKAVLMRELAEARRIDLRGSWAYSDSATDVPMLEAVGHPVAVNPDRGLQQIAASRGWPVERFERIALRTGPGTSPAARRPLQTRPIRSGRRISTSTAGWLAVGAPTVVAMTTGGAWWWKRRDR